MFFEQVEFVNSPVLKFNIYLTEKIVEEKLKNMVKEMQIVGKELRKRWEMYKRGIDDLCKYSFEIDNKELLNYIVSINNTISFIKDQRDQSRQLIDQISDSLEYWKNLNSNTKISIDKLIVCLTDIHELNGYIVTDCLNINSTINQKMNDYLPAINVTL